MLPLDARGSFTELRVEPSSDFPLVAVSTTRNKIVSLVEIPEDEPFHVVYRKKDADVAFTLQPTEDPDVWVLQGRINRAEEEAFMGRKLVPQPGLDVILPKTETNGSYNLQKLRVRAFDVDLFLNVIVRGSELGSKELRHIMPIGGSRILPQSEKMHPSGTQMFVVKGTPPTS